MITDTPAKVALAALVGDDDEEARTAALELRGVVGELLSRAQEAGEARADASVEEVHVLIRALAQATGDPAAVERAVVTVLTAWPPAESPRQATAQGRRRPKVGDGSR